MAGKTAERRRHFEGPAFFAYGFRPFFLGSAIFVGIAVPLWIAIISGRVQVTSDAIDPYFWHAHEMIFGYLGAVMAGFLLTAVPNWTGRLPLMGWPLAGLFALWLGGRAGMALAATDLFPLNLAKLIDCSFLVVLAAALAREVIAGRNWKNVPVVGLIGIMALANMSMNFAEEIGLERGFGERVALGAAMVLMALIGGRITPSFTRNWLSAQGNKHFPAPFGVVDKVALGLTILAALSWIFAPLVAASGVILSAAGTANGVRLVRWRGWTTIREPLVAVLHAGYAWLCLALFLLAGSILAPDLVSTSAALHALTTGAIGTMTLAVMTRASLGHTGRALVSTPGITTIYVLVSAGALLRVAAPWCGSAYISILSLGGSLWAAAFIVFAIVFWPMLTRPRAKPA